MCGFLGNVFSAVGIVMIIIFAGYFIWQVIIIVGQTSITLFALIIAVFQAITDFFKNQFLK
jgi:hypothetical protein